MIYAFFLFVFVQKSFLTKKLSRFAEINLTTRGPLYTWLVDLPFGYPPLDSHPFLSEFSTRSTKPYILGEPLAKGLNSSKRGLIPSPFNFITTILVFSIKEKP